MTPRSIFLRSSFISIYLNLLNQCPEPHAYANNPSQVSNEPTISNEMASSMTVPYASCGMRRKRIPQSRMHRPMLTSLLSRLSKDPVDISFWQVSQEESRRCRQQRHCKHAGHVEPGIEQSTISQLSSTISPFQRIRCISNPRYCSYPTQSIAYGKGL